MTKDFQDKIDQNIGTYISQKYINIKCRYMHLYTAFLQNND